MPVFLLIVIIILLAIAFVVYAVTRPEPLDIENLQPFLCSVSKYRKKDGKIERGECSIEFADNMFQIKQDDKTIENEIDSIYYFDIWEHKNETYFKIFMRSHTEYIFKSVHFEADKISTYLKTKGVKIEDNRT